MFEKDKGIVWKLFSQKQTHYVSLSKDAVSLFKK